MITWITHPQAAEILGVHLTAVGKIVKRGELHPRQVRRSLPSLDRAEVEALAEEWLGVAWGDSPRRNAYRLG